MEDLDQYERIRENTHSEYLKIAPILSPALKEFVFFTPDGFEHLIFKDSRHERERQTQMLRFKLIPMVIRLIAHANTYQEYEETTRMFVRKSRKKMIRENKLIRYWGIIAIFEKRKIKVILRKIGAGKIQFWNVIPAWTTSRYRDIKLISTTKGIPELD